MGHDMEISPVEAPLGSDLQALVRGLRAPLIACDAIDTQRAGPQKFRTFRLRFADGSVRKGRRLCSAVEAERLERIVGSLDADRFSRIVARQGTALLETWIPGTTLDRGTVSPAHLRWAGETLGAVHRTPVPGRWPAKDLAAIRRRLEAELQGLADLGALPGDAAPRLRDLALASEPRGAAEAAVCHHDLCPENIVVDPAGRLVSVDNAGAHLGVAEEDLARTFCRWPMGQDERATFLEAYRALRDPGAFADHEPFFMIAALAHSAYVRRTGGYVERDRPL